LLQDRAVSRPCEAQELRAMRVLRRSREGVAARLLAFVAKQEKKKKKKKKEKKLAGEANQRVKAGSATASEVGVNLAG
jgi:hypothetical protein